MTNTVNMPPAPPQWADLLDVGYFFRRLLTRGWVVLSIAGIAGVLLGLLIILIAPSFKVMTVLRIKPDISQGQSVTSVSAESSLLESRRLVEEVLQKLDRPVDVRYHPAYSGERVETFFSLLGYWLRDEKAPEWLSLTPSLMVQHFKAPEIYYGAQFTVNVSAADTFEVFDKNDVSLGGGRLGKPVALVTPQGQIDMMLERPQNTPSLAQSFILYPRSAGYFTESILKNLDVKENGFAQLGGTLTLKFKNKDSYFAQQFVHTLLDHYMGTTSEENLTAPKQVLEYLTAEVARLEQRLKESRAELVAQRLLHQSIDIPTEARLSLEQVAKLQSDLLVLEQDRRKMAVSLAPDNPALKAIDDQRSRVQQEIAKNQKIIDGIPLAQKEILRLERDIELMVNLLERTKDEQRKAETQLKGITKHVEVLQFPTVEGGLRLRFIAIVMVVVTAMVSMVGFLYLFFGAIPAFARVTSARQLEQWRDATFLYTLPRSSKHLPQVAQTLASRCDMLVIQGVKSKILLVTSFTPLRTSSSFASAIALSMAHAQQVLFVDADIKKPSSQKGLTDVLLTSFDVSDALYESKDNLTVLFSGTATPSYNLLHRNGGKVPKLITALSQGFQTTMVAWPALTQTAANLELLKFAHAVIIVVQHGDKLHALRRMVEDLTHAGVAPLYLVLQK